jgi:uncharacterized membrane protein
MRILTPIAAAFILAACGENVPEADNAAEQPFKQADDASPAGESSWDLVASGEGTALIFPAEGEAAVRLFCPTDRPELLVNVPPFRPVGSEERMSFGSGGNVVALVADTSGDAQRGGVSGTGAVPADLATLVNGPIAVNYGSQNSGPHPAPPADLARGFVTACRNRPTAPAPASSLPPAQAGGAGPCLVQGEEQLANPPLRAVGTEPFWGARIEGRCVTYSHPDDQQGTRVWTRYTPGEGGGGRWSGALGGQLFELVVRPRPGCSDGMSDLRYAFEAELKIGGEQRRGCADHAEENGRLSRSARPG